MKHSTEDLLLAVAVRRIALDLRLQDAPNGDALEEWINSNPARNWIAPALAQLNSIADDIKALP